MFSYAHKACLNSCSTEQDIDNFFARLISCQDSFTCQSRERESAIKPIFQKEECKFVGFKEVRYLDLLIPLLRNHPSLKVIALIRNPFEVLDSWISAPREFRFDLGWNPEEEWRYAFKKNINRPENFFGFEKWKEFYLLVKAAKNLYPSRLHVIDYWNLKTEIISEVKKIYDFLQIPISPQVLKFCEESTQLTNTHAYSVYKNSPKDQSYQSVILSQEINNQIRSELSEIGYKF